MSGSAGRGAPSWGVLLLNLGTPSAPTPSAVRRYLREFLSDPRVIDIPAPLRWLLLNLVILPVRPRASARAYREIWTPDGSPLLVHGRALAIKVARLLGATVHVELAMRYGEPSITSALERLAERGIDRVVVFPMFPQYSTAAWGSAVARVYELAAARWNTPSLIVVPPYYDHPSYVAVLVGTIRETLSEFPAERLLLSYHGLPERQLRRSSPDGSACLAHDNCCAEIGPKNRFCYRAQCLATSRAIADGLGPGAVPVESAFQSRLGRQPWCRPYTEERLVSLAESGVRRLAVACPSFTADCLETLEEIGLRGKETFLAHGGEAFRLVPALNARGDWARTVSAIVEGAMGRDAKPGVSP